MGITPETIVHASNGDLGKTAAGAGTVALAFLGGRLKSGKGSGSILPVGRVPEGEMALRKRLGRARRVRDALFSSANAGDLYGYVPKGWHPCLTTSLQHAKVQQRNHDIEEPVQHRDGEKLDVKATIWWNIDTEEREDNDIGENLYRALYGPTGEENGENALITGVASICASGLYVAIRALENPYEWDNEGIYNTVNDLSREDLIGSYGVRLDALKVRSVVPSDSQLQKEGLTAIAVKLPALGKIVPFVPGQTPPHLLEGTG